ncbi:MAG: hypothetical protein U0768_04210 [Anaerolineae bacterium]
MNVPDAVYWLWGLVLLIAVFIVLPVTVYLLQRVLNAARSIERYLGEMRDAGVGIAGNTSHIPALDDTIGVAQQLLATAGAIDEHAATIETMLTARAADDSSQRVA